MLFGRALSYRRVKKVLPRCHKGISVNLRIRTAKERKHKSVSNYVFKRVSPNLETDLFVKYNNKVMLVKTSWEKGPLVRQLNLECEFSLPYSGSLYSSIQFSLPL